MKKTLITICLMSSAIFAHAQNLVFNGAVSYEDGYNPNYGWEMRFTFEQSGSYGIGYSYGVAGSTANVLAFGYYYLSDPSKLIAGDMESGYIGNFNAGDAIGLWFEVKADINGVPTEGFFSTTDVGKGKSIYKLGGWGGNSFWVYKPDSGSVMLSFSFKNASAPPTPVGEPLPGVIAALAIGGCAFLGRKLTNRVRK